MSEKDDEAQVIPDERAAENREQVRDAEVETAIYNAALEDAALALEAAYGWNSMQSCVTLRALKK